MDKDSLIFFENVENHKDVDYLISILRYFVESIVNNNETTTLDQKQKEQKEQKEQNQKYYYQFEMDSQQTLYEKLMCNHFIAIKASSEKEAMLLNVVLHCLIDKWFGVLLEFFWENDLVYNNEGYKEYLSLDKLAKKIENSDAMSNYQEYVSETPHPLHKNFIVDYAQDEYPNFLFYTLNETLVFTKEMVKKLLYDPLFLQEFKSHFVVNGKEKKVEGLGYDTHLVYMLPNITKIEWWDRDLQKSLGTLFVQPIQY